MARVLASPLFFPNNPLSWVNPLVQTDMPNSLLGEQEETQGQKSLLAHLPCIKSAWL